MRTIQQFSLIGTVIFFLTVSCDSNKVVQETTEVSEKVYLDTNGVIRWTKTDEEIALFGANYCLPSACDYRAAGYVGGDRKEMIHQDMVHFKRMGFDGVRLCFWGDWQNTDVEGNLIENDHLDLLDYLTYEAKEQGIHMLFSPIVTYSAQWPDNMEDTTDLGFSYHFKKWDLGSDPDAINAQVNYLKQILNHVNPYTGYSYKDEPNIIIIEPINEPAHHYDDIPGSITYINTLYDAIRETGCDKLVFFNVSQDFRMVPAIRDSKVEGSTHAWYPTQLMNRRTLQGNFLPFVDKYEQMLDPGLDGKGKLVYEFDTPDMIDSYMLPAMVRTYRTGGIQFANYFSYDMLGTAHANLGWQTHYLNMVYTPHKAVSAVIASKAIDELPRLKSYGNYPENNRFGDFRVSYEEKLSEYVTDEDFMYSNNTRTSVPDPGQLEHIVGCGSSTVIDYEGEGIYFMDKLETGVWKLEIYPDAVIVKDPFGPISPENIVTKIIWREWPMKITLPDLGDDFTVKPLNKENSYESKASDGEFLIRPGIYILAKAETKISPGELNISTEFIAPVAHDLPIQVLHKPKKEVISGQQVQIEAQILCDHEPVRVTCFIRNTGEWRFQIFEMKMVRGYNYAAEIPPDLFTTGLLEYCIVVADNGSVKTFPGDKVGEPGKSATWDNNPGQLWESFLVPSNAQLSLLDIKTDRDLLNFTRIFRSVIFTRHFVPGSQPGKLALQLNIPSFSENEEYQFPLDVSVDHFIGDKIKSRGDHLGDAKMIKVTGRSTGVLTDKCIIALIDKDGMAWTSSVPLSIKWQEVQVPLSEFKPGKAVMLPQDWPGVNPYWYPVQENEKKLQMDNIEKLQLSIRKELFPGSEDKSHGMEIESVGLIF